ncbi:hypothetical protein N665_1492s0018 [Sinapis alba]|nr:hypothetical protein N665_1492s0018 [Sinapis alba]
MSLSRFLVGHLVVTSSVHLVVTSTLAPLFITIPQTPFIFNNSPAHLVVATTPNRVRVVTPPSINKSARSTKSEGMLARPALFIASAASPPPLAVPDHNSSRRSQLFSHLTGDRSINTTSSNPSHIFYQSESYSLYGYVSTGVVFFRGIPLTVSPPFTSSHKSYCLSSPSPSLSGLFLKHLVPIRESKSLCPTVSQPMHLWGVLISLINFLKISVGFSGIFTETYFLAMSHLSCVKKLQPFHLPVDSSGLSSLSSSTSFSLEKRSALSYVSFLRSVSPPNVKWRCMPISIIVCLSCVAVCSGPEDTTDFVSTLVRGADWVSTSYFKVTISQVSSIAVKLTSTHSSCSLNSLSPYPRGFSTSITYVALYFAVRACLNSIPICNPNV